MSRKDEVYPFYTAKPAELESPINWQYSIQLDEANEALFKQCAEVPRLYQDMLKNINEASLEAKHPRSFDTLVTKLNLKQVEQLRAYFKPYEGETLGAINSYATVFAVQQGLEVEGSHHKQHYLMQIANQLGMVIDQSIDNSI